MVRRAEFRKQLAQLRRNIFDGLSYFIVFQDLNIEFEKGNKLLGKDKNFWWRYRGFLAPIRKALSGSALIELSKAYDKNSRTVSIITILNILTENYEYLSPYSTREELNTIQVRIDSNSETLKRLKTLRDKRLAHHDSVVTDNIELPYDDINVLIEETKSIYNSIYYSHVEDYDDFDDIMEPVYLHTKQLIDLLRSQENRG
ncbi:MAG: hypothetical protein PHR56_01755 [Dehalococcoidales bacterium]|nr:hypothetical protein [Dehalococcoidales bacterium]